MLGECCQAVRADDDDDEGGSGGEVEEGEGAEGVLWERAAAVG